MTRFCKKAVFLDRDGVLNHSMVREGKPYPPDTVEELVVISDVPDGLRMLKKEGYLLICVTNQPDVARGKQKRKTVEAMHTHLKDVLGLDEILVCYHDNHDKCICRKPLPGMILDAAKRWSVDCFRSFMVGDRWRDIEAGQNAGCKSVLIDYEYSEKKPKNPPEAVVRSFREAADWILKQPDD